MRLNSKTNNPVSLVLLKYLGLAFNISLTLASWIRKSKGLPPTIEISYSMGNIFYEWCARSNALNHIAWPASRSTNFSCFTPFDIPIEKSNLLLP
jgi:hypothetical protein